MRHEGAKPLRHEMSCGYSQSRLMSSRTSAHDACLGPCAPVLFPASHLIIPNPLNNDRGIFKHLLLRPGTPGRSIERPKQAAMTLNDVKPLWL